MEILDVVNESDQVIGNKPRNEIERDGLLYRVAGIYAFMDGKIIIERRSADKKIRANNYSIVEETVKSGETYREAALRGLEEETGLKAVAMKELGRKIVRDKKFNDNYIIKVFTCKGKGKIKIQEEEVAEVKLMNRKEIEKLIESKEQISPALSETFQMFKEAMK